MSSNEQPSPSTAPLAGNTMRGVILLLIAAGIVYFYQYHAESLTLSSFASKEAELRQYQAENPYLVYWIAFAVYVLVTGMSLPGATVLSLSFAWYFGFFRCLPLVSFASTTGATLAFLLSRYLLRDAVQTKFGDRLIAINESLSREGSSYLFAMRLIPAIPFFVINVVMGLTPMKTWNYWWVSQLGMLPGTIVYVYAGSQFPDLQTLAEQGVGGILTPRLLLAFTVLGLFPWAVKKLWPIRTQ